MTTPAPMLPPRQRLAQIVRSMSRYLPIQMAGLLEHARFADGWAALARLADAAYLNASLAAMGDEEAGWLGDLLLARWRDIGEPQLDPEAAIVAPVEVWLGAEPVRVPVEVVVVGTEPGWEAVWEGATAGSEGRAVVIAEPGAAKVTCRAHVRARTASGRVALTAVARIAVRRPAVTVHEDRRRFVVVDQLGNPAVGVTLRIGDTEHVTGPGGLVELGQPAARGAILQVQGIAAGQIPDGSEPQRAQRAPGAPGGKSL